MPAEREKIVGVNGVWRYVDEPEKPVESKSEDKPTKVVSKSEDKPTPKTPDIKKDDE